MAAGASETGHDFVGEDEGLSLPYDWGDAFEPSRRLGDQACWPLEQGFDDEPGVWCFAFLNFLFYFVHAFPVALARIAGVYAVGFGSVEWASIAIRSHDAVTLEEHPGVSLVEQVDVSSADGADGVAVIGTLKAEEPGLASEAAAPCVFIA